MRQGRAFARIASSLAVALALGLAATLAAACSRPGIPSREVRTATAPQAAARDTLVLGDKFGFGSDTVIGARLTGKFQSRAALAQYLAMSRPLAGAGGEARTLFDILVSMDASANGNVVSWTVAGPAASIRPYVASLKAVAADHSVFYDFSASFVPVKYCCAD